MKSKTTGLSQKVTKKMTRQEVYEKLAGALAEYKEGLKEKKFVRNLKRASKLLAGDITKAIRKKATSSETRNTAKQAS